MSRSVPENMEQIRQEMTVLEIVSKYRETEAIFKQYDHQAGECICCQALFEPLKNVAVKYGLDLERLLSDLEKSVKER